MSEKLGRLIDVEQASIKTVAVEIKALMIGKKQMTLSVFRQLPVDDEVVSFPDLTFRGELWGKVRQDGASAGYFVVWQKDNTLHKCWYNKDSLLAGEKEFKKKLKSLQTTIDYYNLYWSFINQNLTYPLDLGGNYIIKYSGDIKEPGQSYVRALSIQYEVNRGYQCVRQCHGGGRPNEYYDRSSAAEDVAKHRPRLVEEQKRLLARMREQLLEVPTHWLPEDKLIPAGIHDNAHDLAHTFNEAIKTQKQKLEHLKKAIESLDQLFIAV